MSANSNRYLIQYVLMLKDRFTPEFKRIQQSIRGQESHIRKANARINKNTSKTTKQVGNAWANSSNRIKASIGKIGDAVSGASKKYGGMIEQTGLITSYAARAALRLGPLTAILVGLGVAIFGVVKMLRMAWEEGKVFEQTMANLKAILDPTDKAMVQLTAHARMLGENTKFTASEVGDAMTMLGKMGFSTNEIIESSGAVLNLASATMEQMDIVATATAATIRQFGLEAKDASKVTDVMAKSFNKSALDLSKFSDSMRYVGPTAKSVGLSVEETTGALAALANRAIHGSQAGTSLRRVLLKLSDQSSSVSKKLKSMGVDGAASLTEKLQALKSAGMGVTELKRHFGILAVTTADVMIKSADSVEQYTETLENAGGTAERMARTQLDTLQGKLTLLRSAFTETKLRIFDTFKGPAKDAVDAIIESVKDLSDVVTKNEGAFKNFAGIFKIISWWAGKAIDAIDVVIRGVDQLANMFQATTMLLHNIKQMVTGGEDFGDAEEAGKKAETIMFHAARHKKIIIEQQHEQAKYNDQLKEAQKLFDKAKSDKHRSQIAVEMESIEGHLDKVNTKLNKSKLAMLGYQEEMAEATATMTRAGFGDTAKQEQVMKDMMKAVEIPVYVKPTIAPTIDRGNMGAAPFVNPADPGADIDKAKKVDQELKRANSIALKAQEELQTIHLSGMEKELKILEIGYDKQRALLVKKGVDDEALWDLNQAKKAAIKKKYQDQEIKREEKHLKAIGKMDLKIAEEAALMSYEAGEERDIAKVEQDAAKQLAKYEKELEQVTMTEELRAQADETRALMTEQTEQRITEIETKYSNQRIAQADRESKQKVQAMAKFFGGVAKLTALAAKDNRDARVATKGLLIAEATMNTYAAANMALASAPPPFNYLAMAGVIAAGLANVIQIKNQSFANGGIVAGNSFTGDRVNANVNSGEMIMNTRQQKGLWNFINSGSGGQRQVTNSQNATYYGGNVTITFQDAQNDDHIRGVVMDAIDESNMNFARTQRQNEEFGVTA